MELTEVGGPSISGLGFQIAYERESKPSTSVYLSLLLDLRKQCDQWPATRLACRDDRAYPGAVALVRGFVAAVRQVPAVF